MRIRNMARRAGSWVAVAAVIAFGASPILAVAQDDSPRIRELERRLQESLQRIEALAHRVEELEGRVPPSKSITPPAATAARVEALERTVSDMAAAPRNTAESGVPLHGFADVGYERTTNSTDPRRSGFVLGNLDLYLTPSLGDRVKTLAELVFEVTNEGALATDLERLQLGYAINDGLTVWLGRFHTPYGYWNAAFHHGAQIQTSVTRPRFIDFEDKGGILPAHAVGAWATGQSRLGNGRLHYDAYIANGNRLEGGILDFNAHRDDNSNKLVGGNIAYAPRGSLDGLVFGLHGFRQDVGAYADGNLVSRTRVTMAGGYAYLDAHDWEGIGEYYRFHDRDMDRGETHSSWAAFLQVGRTFADLWTPYYRYERTALDAGDDYFALQDSGRSYKRHVAGVRYNLDPRAALKFEANRTREGQPERSYSELRAQFAIRF